MIAEDLSLPARGDSAELYNMPSQTDNTNTREPPMSKAEEKAALRKIDRRLVPIVGILYCFSVISRANLPSASIAGMHDDLDLSGNRYSIVLLVFFPTYIFCQPVAAVLGRQLGPRNFFTGITISTGLLVVGMGFMKSWVDLVIIRLLMGAIVSGFFASCLYLLSTWYSRVEVGKRFSFFYILVSLSYAFGGIMSFGFTYMDGLGNLRGWSWIFIMEGLLTLLTGIWGYWLLVGFPDATKPSRRFLSQRELSWVLKRVNDERGDVDLHGLSFRTALLAAKDFKVWAFGLISFNNSVVNFALANFLPIILRNNMGFDLGESQILVAPPYAIAALAMWLAGWAGDKYRYRGPFIIIAMVTSIFGCALMGFHSQGGVRYVGAFLTTAGTYSAIPVSMAYQANNIRGQWKRAFSSALVVAISGLGGIVGSFVFRSRDAPRYLPGLVFCLACALFNIVIVLGLSSYFYVMNRRADRNHMELETSDEAGNRGFRYIL